MDMTRQIFLSWLTTAPLPPRSMIGLAKECGYAGVSLRALPAAAGDSIPQLLQDRALRQSVKYRALADEIILADMEIIRINEGFAVQSVEPFLDLCAELSVSTFLVAGDDPDLSRLTASFNALCEASRAKGICPALEFMPWTSVKDVKTALSIIENSGSENGKIIVDALHVARSSTTLDDLRAIPRERLACFQICDALAAIPQTQEGLIYTARQARLLPGQGGIDLHAILEALPPDIPVSVEIPNKEGHDAQGAAGWAKNALIATISFLNEELVK
ncbi:sugar phosphate isomerase/epimerase [Acetobacter senegalensis]|uniref:sugar phosphate isomerase/epimerase family protein n=1 Tax=Acetobacter senegalensis TaxID=446692 RepID=UPI00209D9447|nr:sugar phosphate isomerase/epimerase [Acetobacter senegalensis]MCP1196047.1 sugar phosphate isomerase/epimerase [Acetobacter senegalensis]